MTDVSPDHNLFIWCRGAIQSNADRVRLSGLATVLAQVTPALQSVGALYGNATHEAVTAEINLSAERAAEAVRIQIALAAQTASNTTDGLSAKLELLITIAKGQYQIDELARSIGVDVARLAGQRPPDPMPTISAAAASQTVH